MQNLSLPFIIKRTNVHRPLLFHSILWTLAFAILIFVFTKGKYPVGIDVLYTCVFLVFISIPVCINFYVLIPKFLKQEQYIAYIGLFLINALVFGALIYYFFQPFLDLIFPAYFFISYLTSYNLVIVIAIFLVSTTLLKLGEDWFYFNSNENRNLKLKSQHFETQLSALRSQINPHFLFNALNVIYALALSKKESVTKAIIELSDILRYVIYDSNTESVTLEDEIKLLKNYIAFQDHRLDTTNPTTLEITVENAQFKIFPMLLLPLLENSYKHGVISGTDSDPINIIMTQQGKSFTFKIANPILSTNNTIKDKYSGVGLDNLKSNLELVYPKRHQLDILNEEDKFIVTLELEDE